MKTRFEWQTEDRDSVVSRRPAESEPDLGKRYRRVIFLVTVLILISGGVGWSWYRQKQESLEGAKEAVLLAHQVQMQALIEHDRELFISMLSSDSEVWRQEQLHLLNEERVEDLSDLGLIHGSESRQTPSVSVTADLQQAVISYIRTYHGLTENDNGREIELRHTRHYKREANRWLQAEPSEVFWGARNESHGRQVHLSYPSRDAALARLLFARIDSHLRSKCTGLEIEGNYPCSREVPLRINLSTEPHSLSAFGNLMQTSTGEFDYELPAPTLLGTPFRGQDYEYYVSLYAKPLLEKIDSVMTGAVRYPTQHIYALCYAHPAQGKSVHAFDIRRRFWQPILVEHNFDYLTALPDDSSVMLFDEEAFTLLEHQITTKSVVDSGQWYWRRSGKIANFASMVGWVDRSRAAYQSFQNMVTVGQRRQYSLLDLNACLFDMCESSVLPGFPTWSNTGKRVLFSSGSALFVGNDQGELLRQVGVGYAPFWLDDSAFGYVQFESDDRAIITSQLVLSSGDGRRFQVILDGRDLARAAGIGPSDDLFINDVIVSPTNSELLLLSARGIGDFAGMIYVFAVDISGRVGSGLQPHILLLLAREGSAVGIPGHLSPSGLKSFLVSPNGRWIVITQLQRQDEDWAIVIHDTLTGTTQVIDEGIPAMPGNSTLLDWSANSQWLLIADREVIHLVSPELNYQEVIAHDFDICTHVAWAD